MPKVTMRSDRSDWLTPQLVWHPAQEMMDGIDLDPCSDSRDSGNIPATVHYTAAMDGLSQCWLVPSGRGTELRPSKVFMNPPYDRRQTHARFVCKLLDECDVGHVEMAVLLLAARTDTRWYRALARFPRVHVAGRLKFLQPSGKILYPAPFPSAIFGVGVSESKLHRYFGHLGDTLVVVRRREQQV